MFGVALCVSILIGLLPCVNAARLLKVPISSKAAPRNVGQGHLQGRVPRHSCQCAVPRSTLQDYIVKVVAAVQTGNNQTFENVLIDTGSAILWVGGQQLYQPGHNTQRINQTFSVGYGTGGVKGIAYRDNVTIGEARATAQIIGAATTMGGFEQVEPIDGILGLGPSKSNSGEVSGYSTTPTFVETLAAQGSIDAPVFGLYVQPSNASGGLAGVGELSFGGPDPDRVEGNITWLPQNPPVNQHWEFNVSGMNFGKVALTKIAPARTDSGVLSIEIPTDQLFAIKDAYNGTLDSTYGFEGFLCFPLRSEPTLPSLNFTLGNKTFSIPPAQYMIPPALYPSFNMTFDRIHTWVSPAGFGSYTFGQKFLERVYTVYDMANHRVGFAHTP